MQAHADDVLIQPGEWQVARAPARFRTVLGSCVAISLWSPELHCGGICHYLLPERRHPTVGTHEEAGRYGDLAFPLLLQAMKQLQVDSIRCIADIYGGGDMFPGAKMQASEIGLRNIEIAHAMVKTTGAQLRHVDVGGNSCRSLIFDVASGEITLRRYVMEQVIHVRK